MQFHEILYDNSEEKVLARSRHMRKFLQKQTLRTKIDEFMLFNWILDEYF